MHALYLHKDYSLTSYIVKVIKSKDTKQPTYFNIPSAVWVSCLRIIHLISPWISRHDWTVLCEKWHQDRLMGLEIYAGTIWAALAFKLQSSVEMENDKCIKIKRTSNWPSQWELAPNLSADRLPLCCGEFCGNMDVRPRHCNTLSPSSHRWHDICG